MQRKRLLRILFPKRVLSDRQLGSYVLLCIIVGILAVIISGSGFQETSAEDNTISLTRLQGECRYETAQKISEAGWQNSSSVILAQGEDFPDALAGVPLAYKLDAPILLTPSDTLIDKTREQIEHLEASEIIILGGKTAISNAVQEELEEDMGLEVRRLSGKDRYHTAALIADEFEPHETSQAVIACGGNFPDALSAASYAAVEGFPILLTQKDELSEHVIEALEKLDIEKTIVVGGEAVVSEKVYGDLPEAVRVSGENRFETSVALANHFAPQEQTMFASGLDFPDAITGAAYAARRENGILLVDNEVPSVLKEYLITYPAYDLLIFGGEKAVTKDIEGKLCDLGMRCPEKEKSALEKINNSADKEELQYLLEDNAVLLGLNLSDYEELDYQWAVAWAVYEALPYEESSELKEEFNAAVKDVQSGEIVNRTPYNYSISEMADIQREDSAPVTDLYGGGWQSPDEEDLLFFIDPLNFDGSEQKAVKITASELNVRREPTTESDVLTKVGEGEEYVLITDAEGKEGTSSSTEGIWYKIHAGHRIGWVYNDFTESTVKTCSEGLFQFLLLSGQAGIEEEELNEILNTKGNLEGKADAFIWAGEHYDINEIFLASLALHETGDGTSTLAEGVKVEDKDDLFSDQDEVKVYNMFGIGAYDEAPIEKGAERAYEERWFSPEEAIRGGARFISALYVNNKDYQQDTLYKMRWNPLVPGMHQYATDISWAAKQVVDLKELYGQLDNYVLRFDIPKYKE